LWIVWILATVTKPYSGKPRTRLGFFSKEIVISDVYHTPGRRYLLRRLLQGLYLFAAYQLVTMNDFSFPWLVWNLASHYEVTFTWSYAAFYLPVFVKGYGLFFLAVMGAHLFLWRITKKRFVVVAKGGGFLKTGRMGFPRYQLYDGDSVLVEPVHPKALEEEDANAKRKERAYMRGHKIMPFLPHYYRDSRPVYSMVAGQPRKLADIYGVENAEKFALRVRWAVTAMAKVTAETDWKAYKRKLRGLDQ
jgi:hypothetical protein